MEAAAAITPRTPALERTKLSTLLHAGRELYVSGGAREQLDVFLKALAAVETAAASANVANARDKARLEAAGAGARLPSREQKRRDPGAPQGVNAAVAATGQPQPHALTSRRADEHSETLADGPHLSGSRQGSRPAVLPDSAAIAIAKHIASGAQRRGGAGSGLAAPRGNAARGGNRSRQALHAAHAPASSLWDGENNGQPWQGTMRPGWDRPL
mmetsp:Transcript_60218/g.138143  ORF Transcript_60218/g.138143 Transcript_60218/m.138143 type:complete len:214 (-) Transcript_60218:229-870(-)